MKVLICIGIWTILRSPIYIAIAVLHKLFWRKSGRKVHIGVQSVNNSYRLHCSENFQMHPKEVCERFEECAIRVGSQGDGREVLQNKQLVRFLKIALDNCALVLYIVNCSWNTYGAWDLRYGHFPVTEKVKWVRLPYAPRYNVLSQIRNVLVTKGVCELPFRTLPNPKGGDGYGERYNGANRGKGNAAYRRPPDRKEWSLTQAETL